MKKLFFLFILVNSLIVNAQVPAGFNYQAVVRNSSGEIITNQTVKFKFSILQNSATGTSVYVETQSATTNDFGVTNLVIGEGEVLLGVLDQNGWGLNKHFLKVEFDPLGGSAFVHLGTTQLLAVPYAFHAQTVEEDQINDADSDPENEIQDLHLSGTVLSLSRSSESVTLPTAGDGGDNWGIQTVQTDASLTGEGTSSNPLSVNGDLTDDQDLSIVGNELSISDGNTVTLPTGVGSLWAESEGNIYRSTGNIGIGTTNPSALLHVNGSIKIMDGTEGTGKVLTSNSTGLASWQTPSIGEENPWLTDDNDIYFNAGKVGVGKKPGADLRRFQSWAENEQAVAAENKSSIYATLFVRNNGSGIAAEFRNSVKIVDGTQGNGKVLTSDANGLANWQTPSGSSPWLESSGDLYYPDGTVSIGDYDSNLPHNLQVNGSSASAILDAASSSAYLDIDRASVSGNYAQVIFANAGIRQYRIGLFPNSTNFWISASYNSLSGLEVKTTGDVEFSNELHSANTGSANMMPFAYGYVTSTGAKSSATSNVGTTSRLSTGQYKVNISDLGSGYIAIVTPNQGSAYLTGVITVRSSTGITVAIWDTKLDTYKDGGFSFVIYKP